MSNNLFNQYKQNENVYVDAVSLTMANCDVIFQFLKSVYGKDNVQIHKTYTNKHNTDLFFVSIYFKTSVGDFVLRNNYYLVVYTTNKTNKVSAVSVTPDEFLQRYNMLSSSNSVTGLYWTYANRGD